MAETLTRGDLHTLVDALPDSELATAARILAALRDTAGAEAALTLDADPFLARLEAAPVDDEPMTADDLAAVAEGLEDLRRGQTEPWEVVRQRLAHE